MVSRGTEGAASLAPISPGHPQGLQSTCGGLAFHMHGLILTL